MNILSIAYPFAPVQAAAVGGAEHILGVLDSALVASGQRSIVVACEGSSPAGELFAASLPAGKRLDAADSAWCRREMQAAIDRAIASRHIDLVHMHGLDFHQYRLPPHLPVLVTLHMPLSWYPSGVWQQWRGGAHFQCVSAAQYRSAPADLRDCGLSVVENGVALPPWSEADATRPRENFALVLGRVCPEKNAHEAFDAGTLAGVPVKLGGAVFPYATHLDYFAREIEPRLATQPSAVRHEFLGPLGAPELRAALRSARCLLHPTLAPETSSLVAMDALAAGTPVIAYRSGALPEIVEDGVTGFLVNNVQEMAAALGRVDEILRPACHRAAETRFREERMIERYFDLYRSLVLAKDDGPFSQQPDEVCFA